MTVIPARYSEGEIDGVVEAIAKLYEKSAGKVLRNKNMGKIKLAYPIDGNRYGTYVLWYVEMDTAAMKKLDLDLRLADEVLRHITIACPKGIPTAEYKLVSYVQPLTAEGRRVSADRDDKVSPAKLSAAESVSSEEINTKLEAILDSDIMKNV